MALSNRGADTRSLLASSPSSVALNAGVSRLLEASIRIGSIAGAIGLFALATPPAQAANVEQAVLTIIVENVSAQGGALQVALYDEASYAGHDQPPVAKLSVDAKAPETVLTIPHVLPGVYAVKMFQDFHRTGSFAMSGLGIPEEPFGFSNDARPLFDQPGFDSAKFSLASGATSIVVHLRSL